MTTTESIHTSIESKLVNDPIEIQLDQLKPVSQQSIDTESPSITSNSEANTQQQSNVEQISSKCEEVSQASNQSNNVIQEENLTSITNPLLHAQQIKTLKTICKYLKKTKGAENFSKPVDPVALGIPQYFEIISNPMDLDWKEFVADMDLMVQNCITFNSRENVYSQIALTLQANMHKHLEKLPKEYKKRGSEVKLEPIHSRSDNPRPKRETHAPARVEFGDNLSPGRKQRKHLPEFKFCNSVWRELTNKKYPFHLPFLEPVDTQLVPSYSKIIQHPMDLTTIKKKLDSDIYNSCEEFEADVRLIFKNCFQFNLVGDSIHTMGRQLEQVFNSKWAEKPYEFPAPAAKSLTRKYRDDSDNEYDSAEDRNLLMQMELDKKKVELQITNLKISMEKRRKRRDERMQQARKRPQTNGSQNNRKRGKRQKRIKSFESEDEEIKSLAMDEVPVLTSDQQMKLSLGINKFDDVTLQRVLQIIKESTKYRNLDEAQGEIEIDLATMDVRTQFRLYTLMLSKESQSTKRSYKRRPDTGVTNALGAISHGESSSGESSDGSSSDSGSVSSGDSLFNNKNKKKKGVVSKQSTIFHVAESQMKVNETKKQLGRKTSNINQQDDFNLPFKSHSTIPIKSTIELQKEKELEALEEEKEKKKKIIENQKLKKKNSSLREKSLLDSIYQAFDGLEEATSPAAANSTSTSTPVSPNKTEKLKNIEKVADKGMPITEKEKNFIIEENENLRKIYFNKNKQNYDFEILKKSKKIYLEFGLGNRGGNTNSRLEDELEDEELRLGRELFRENILKERRLRRKKEQEVGGVMNKADNGNLGNERFE
ncbi:hypothetical protein HK099_002424 [Clydaea vesicula]|uniref:Bromodomain-containing protein n=1 Tax=Clydaea vesicula TaxID=447962 RepID=A0AAD5U7L4_9FUNG|nr:hypothetical protein HK099_002424 [Clydaea vesicula]